MKLIGFAKNVKLNKKAKSQIGVGLSFVNVAIVVMNKLHKIKNKVKGK
jgi:hypothetical protein